MIESRFVPYRKLLSPPVVPLETDSTYFSGVGLVSNPTLDDLKEIMPDIARSLKEVLEYSGNIEEDMMLTFEVSVEEYGKVHTTVLKTNKGRASIFIQGWAVADNEHLNFR